MHGCVGRMQKLSSTTPSKIYFAFLLKRHTRVSGSRPLPRLIRPRSCSAFIVLRLAEAGRITSLIIFQLPQDRVAAERISLQLVPVLQVR